MALKCDVFTSDGNWTCPSGVRAVLLQMTGPGGGSQGNNGFTFLGSPGLSGGTGEFCCNLNVPVTPGTVYAVTVGTGGTAVSGTSTRPTAGTGYASFSIYKALPAQSGNLSENQRGNGAGYGGGPLNFGGSGNSSGLQDNTGLAESRSYYGGNGGRSAGRGTSNCGIQDGQARIWSSVSTAGTDGADNYELGGCGGPANLWPHGGNGGDGTTITSTPPTAGTAGTGWGSAGGTSGVGGSIAGGPYSGGAGCKGAVLIYYMA